MVDITAVTARRREADFEFQRNRTILSAADLALAFGILTILVC